MSSTYPSNNSSYRCQRCGASLALNNPRCPNCGYLHPVQSGNNVQQQASQSWNSSTQQGQSEPSIPPHQQGPQQSSGLLKRYATHPEPHNSYAPQAPFSAAPGLQEAPHPVPPRASLHSTPSQAMQQNMPNNSNPYPYPSTNQYINNSYPQNIAQAPLSSASSIDPTTPPVSFRATSQQLPPPAYTQASQPLQREAGQRRQFRSGRVVGVLVLLLVLIGGSFLAYTFLFQHEAARQTTSSTVSAKPLATPQGTPLFHDEFMNNSNGWSIQSYPGEFSVALGNGALKLENDNNKLLWELVPGNKTYSDFQLSVDAVLSKGSQDNGYGVYIRSGLSQNAAITTFYRFELYGDGSFAIFKGTTDAKGTVTTPRLVDYTNSSAIQKQGSLNHIMITAKGSSLQFIVNGQMLSTVSDATYTSGSIALFVSNLQKAQSGATATFSHLAIYPAQN